MFWSEKNLKLFVQQDMVIFSPLPSMNGNGDVLAEIAFLSDALGEGRKKKKANT